MYEYCEDCLVVEADGSARCCARCTEEMVRWLLAREEEEGGEDDAL